MIHDWQSGWILKKKASDLSKCWRKKIRNPNPAYFLSRVPPWRHETPNGPMVLKISAMETLWFFNQPEANGTTPVARFSPYHLGAEKSSCRISGKSGYRIDESMNISQPKTSFSRFQKKIAFVKLTLTLFGCVHTFGFAERNPHQTFRFRRINPPANGT